MYFLLCSSAGSVLPGKDLTARSKGEKNPFVKQNLIGEGECNYLLPEW